MKLYTRTGDQGQTGLYGADRVSKAHPRVEAYGTVDELNSALGLARAHASGDATLDADLEYLQNALFDVGADLEAKNKVSTTRDIRDVRAPSAATHRFGCWPSFAGRAHTAAPCCGQGARVCRPLTARRGCRHRGVR